MVDVGKNTDLKKSGLAARGEGEMESGLTLRTSSACCWSFASFSGLTTGIVKVCRNGRYEVGNVRNWNQRSRGIKSKFMR